jgi:hypothetical protein
MPDSAPFPSAHSRLLLICSGSSSPFSRVNVPVPYLQECRHLFCRRRPLLCVYGYSTSSFRYLELEQQALLLLGPGKLATTKRMNACSGSTVQLLTFRGRLRVQKYRNYCYHYSWFIITSVLMRKEDNCFCHAPLPLRISDCGT